MEGLQVLGERHQGSPADWLYADAPRRPDGILGNIAVQLPAGGRWASVRPGPWVYPTRLGRLKARVFTGEGRDSRIRRSLEAVDRPLKYDLDRETWRWVAEAVDIEDIGQF